MSNAAQPTGDPEEMTPVNKDELYDQLSDLEDVVTTQEQMEEVEKTRQLLDRLPGTSFVERRIDKFTSRDMGEATVGSIVFSLPLLVEDGVFEIAEFFLSFRVLEIPVLLVVNVLFICVLTAKILYVVDFRDVVISHPIFGIIPRRLVGVLGISFLVTAGLMILWGRVFEEDPTRLEMFARITVIWAAAALGATLGDILPGESKGTDLTRENIGDFLTDGEDEAE